MSAFDFNLNQLLADNHFVSILTNIRFFLFCQCFGTEFTLYDYLLQYSPKLIARLCGGMLPLIFYQNCSDDLLWEKIVLKWSRFFGDSRLKAENLQNYWDYYNNLFKWWNVGILFGNRMLFQLVPGGFLYQIN